MWIEKKLFEIEEEIIREKECETEYVWAVLRLKKKKKATLREKNKNFNKHIDSAFLDFRALSKVDLWKRFFQYLSVVYCYILKALLTQLLLKVKIKWKAQRQHFQKRCLVIYFRHRFIVKRFLKWNIKFITFFVNLIKALLLKRAVKRQHFIQRFSQ
jgi:hypothetical protein